MPNRIRAILFIIFTIAFVTSAVFISLYALGYKMDFEKRKFTSTGGLFLKMSHSGAKIFFNDKFKREIGFTRTLRLTDLIPKQYNVKIKKDGYHTWEKNLEVKPREVTEARNILLVKQNPEKEKLFEKQIESYLISPNKEILVFKTTEKEIGLVKDLNNLKEEVVLGLSKDIVKNLELKDFSIDSKKLFLLNNVTKKYLIWDIENNELVPLYLSIENPRWHPKDKNRFYFIDENKDLCWYDLFEKEKSPPVARDIISYNFLTSDTLGFIEKKNEMLFKSDLWGQNKTQLIFMPLGNLNSDATIEILAYHPNILILKNEALYIFDLEKSELRELKNDVGHAEFSSLGKGFLFATQNEIWVYFAQDVHIQPFRNAGDTELIARFGEKIKESHWYTKDNEHIIFQVGSTIKIIELDERGGRNIVDFIYLNNANLTNITYNEKDDKLYFLDEGFLWRAKIR